jgi:hypothetical protein
MNEDLVPHERIESCILLIRGQRVILDDDIAVLYAVETGQLVRAVLRNVERFPDDFMFRLTVAEFADARRERRIPVVHGGRRKPPYAFTEHGVAMLSGVLRSPRAVEVNIEIVRAFVRLRGALSVHKDLTRRLDELEVKYDGQFGIVFEAIRQLMLPPARARKPIGFSP